MRSTFGGALAYAYGAGRMLRNLGSAVLITTGFAHAETVTIAALGDSLTAGYGLPQADGFVPQLQAWLDAQGADALVLNAGVSGDTSAGGLSRVDWTLTPDVDAMIVTLGGNDFLRGLDPMITQQNIDGILQAGQAAEVQMLLVGLEVSSNYGLDYKAAFEGLYPALAEKHDVPLYPDFAAGLRAAAEMQEGMSAFLQPDGIHPNKDGVAAIVAAIGPEVLALIDAVE